MAAEVDIFLSKVLSTGVDSAADSSKNVSESKAESISFAFFCSVDNYSKAASNIYR